MHAAVENRVEPDREEQDILGRAVEQVPEAWERPAEPAGLDGVADDPQADENKQPAPGETGIAREGPDQADGRQIGDRLDHERGQGELAADLVPARVPVEEPLEAPG